jgi:RhoGAP domain
LSHWNGYTWLLPQWLHDTIDFIVDEGVTEVGIFRVSPEAEQMNKFRAAIDAGERVDVRSASSVHVAAGLLKLYLRELPCPLLSGPLCVMMEEVGNSTESAERNDTLRRLVYSLPEPNQTFWLLLNKLWAAVLQKCDANKMTAQNLAVVFGPSIFNAESATTNALDAVAELANQQRALQAVVQVADAIAAGPPTPRTVAWARATATNQLIALHALDFDTDTLAGTFALSGEPIDLSIDDIDVVYRCRAPSKALDGSTLLTRSQRGSSQKNRGRYLGANLRRNAGDDLPRGSSPPPVSLVDLCSQLLDACADMQERLASCGIAPNPSQVRLTNLAQEALLKYTRPRSPVLTEAPSPPPVSPRGRASQPSAAPAPAPTPPPLSPRSAAAERPQRPPRGRSPTPRTLSPPPPPLASAVPPPSLSTPQ